MNFKKVISVVLSTLTIFAPLNVSAMISETESKASEKKVSTKVVHDLEICKKDMIARKNKIETLGKDMNFLLKEIIVSTIDPSTTEEFEDIRNRLYNITKEFRETINSTPNYTDAVRTVVLPNGCQPFPFIQPILTNADSVCADLIDCYSTQDRFVCYLMYVFERESFNGILNLDLLRIKGHNYISGPSTLLDATKRISGVLIFNGCINWVAEIGYAPIDREVINDNANKFSDLFTFLLAYDFEKCGGYNQFSANLSRKLGVDHIVTERYDEKVRDLISYIKNIKKLKFVR